MPTALACTERTLIKVDAAAETEIKGKPDVGSLGELLAAGEKQTLEFFVVRLKEVSEPAVDRQELLYNASVLAHYALVSTRRPSTCPRRRPSPTCSTSSCPTPPCSTTAQ